MHIIIASEKVWIFFKANTTHAAYKKLSPIENKQKSVNTIESVTTL